MGAARESVQMNTNRRLTVGAAVCGGKAIWVRSAWEQANPIACLYFIYCAIALPAPSA